MRALLSVANRDEITGLARDLLDLGVEIFATDGTREHLAGEGVQVGSVTELTHVPPLVGGQVKTFHPAVYAGILARRDVAEQLDELEANEIGLIDIVVVNVAPFAPAVGARLVGIDEAIEMIDVGGAALLGAAARNAAGVAAVSSPRHYAAARRRDPRARPRLARSSGPRLAAEAFGTVAAYYAEIAAYLNQISGNMFPDRLALVLEKVDDLRYGENPHQHAAFYRETTHRSGTLADATQIRGARPSFNNLLDLDSAYRIAMDFTAPTVAIVKHTDPVGLASARRARRGLPARARDRLRRGVRRHRRRQPRARRTDGPGDRGELVRGGRRPGLRPGGARHPQGEERPRDPRGAAGPDRRDARLRHREPRLQAGRWRPARREPRRPGPRPRPAPGRDPPPADARRAQRPAVRVAGGPPRPVERDRPRPERRDGRDRAAQASRQVSVEIALRRAGDRAKTAVMASDAYFPFPDGIQMAAQAGITAIVQPGGSIRDEMAIEVADRHHLAMVFTGTRHFRH